MHCILQPTITGEYILITKITRDYKNNWNNVNPWSRLSRVDAFQVEYECLTRLNALPAGNTPILIKCIPEEFKFILTDCGVSFWKLRDDINISNLDSQVNNIIHKLRSCGIIYLDNHSSGKNLCVSKDGIISLIDFDGCVIDSKFKTNKMKKMFEDKHNNNINQHYRDLKQGLLDIVSNNKYVTLIGST